MSQRPRTSENLAQRVVRRIGWAVRDAWPDRAVRRHVQGVDLWLPWSHRLPDYARLAPSYGQNLVDLAALLAVDGIPLTVVDVGANVGDSTLQILNAVPSRVLCVEADGFFLDYLRRNVGDDPRVTIEASLLEPDSGAEAVQMAPVRVGGTTRFEPGTSTETAPTVSTVELRRRHPELDRLRLVKSDTDGYDVTLVPALARTWSDSRPVLFFEYDHVLSRLAGNHPLVVWDEPGRPGVQRGRGVGLQRSAAGTAGLGRRGDRGDGAGQPA
ncbi:FkbM family methyltransferase [Aeromicrobium sp. UC242_57]|uniref:FkbM family methyltransferase n=1 Tax=Aeromicrobium sp. UC242_57 TaxID=3374624 RepID=UPI00379CF192